MSCVDQLNTHICAAHEKGVEMTAMKTKCYLDAKLLETLGEKVAAEQFAAV